MLGFFMHFINIIEGNSILKKESIYHEIGPA